MKGANSMAVSGFGCREAFIGIGKAISVLLDMCSYSSEEVDVGLYDTFRQSGV